MWAAEARAAEERRRETTRNAPVTPWRILYGAIAAAGMLQGFRSAISGDGLGALVRFVVALLALVVLTFDPE